MLSQKPVNEQQSYLVVPSQVASELAVKSVRMWLEVKIRQKENVTVMISVVT